MAIRHETQRKRNVMRQAILELCRSGGLRNNEPIPPIRNLAREYDLSVNVASEVVHSLIADGVLHSRQGAGTFVGSSSLTDVGIFLFLLPPEIGPGFAATSYFGTTQRGFELRVTQLGGSCLTLEYEKVIEYLKRGDLPPLSGVFSIDGKAANNLNFDSNLPRAWFGDQQPHLKGDALHFDDHEGGRQAVRHLVSLGHRNIALLTLHTPGNPDAYRWSAEREVGWYEELLKTNTDIATLAFHPDHDLAPYESDFLQAARDLATTLLPRLKTREITAVVAVNSHTARSLFQVLEQAQIPAENWPAVVSFDSHAEVDNQVVSAFHLPWDEIGKAGAQLLWERKTGTLSGDNQLRLIPMQLITRLTCRAIRAEASSFVQHQVFSSPWMNEQPVEAVALAGTNRVSLTS